MTLFYRKYTFWILLAGTAVMLVLMFLSGRPLTTPATPRGILCLEFAYTGEGVENILNSWRNHSTSRENIVAAALLNTYLDFIFLFFYSLFLFTCCRQLAASLPGKKTFSALARWASYAALLAGLSDIFENLGMLKSMAAGGSDAVAMATTVFAAIKWVIVLPVIGMILAGLVYSYRVRTKTGKIDSAFAK